VKVAIGCALTMLACSVDEREKPAQPDMDELVEGYASPSRNFDAAAADELKDILESKIDALLDLDRLTDTFDKMLAALGDNKMAASGKHPVDLSGDGYARIERICTGFGEPLPPIDKAVNGSLQLTVGYTENGLDSVVSGRAIACAEQVESERLLINGDINLYIGNALRVDAVPTTPVLFELANFAFAVNDTELVSGGFDFQICRGEASTCRSGFVEMLIAMPSGGTIVVFIDPATHNGGFRAANGIWTCAFREGHCTGEDGTVITTPTYHL
jgi:hypothetical protein